MKILPQSTFVLTPLGRAALKPESGTISGNWRSVRGRNAARDGQKVTTYKGVVWTLQGTRGTLTIRERSEWVDTGSDVNRDSFDDVVALGTWTVVRDVWNARYEGFLTTP
jgi:hypothetical protein